MVVGNLVTMIKTEVERRKSIGIGDIDTTGEGGTIIQGPLLVGLLEAQAAAPAPLLLPHLAQVTVEMMTPALQAKLAPVVMTH